MSHHITNGVDYSRYLSKLHSYRKFVLDTEYLSICEVNRLGSTQPPDVYIMPSCIIYANFNDQAKSDQDMSL